MGLQLRYEAKGGQKGERVGRGGMNKDEEEEVLRREGREEEDTEKGKEEEMRRRKERKGRGDKEMGGGN